MDQLDKLKNNKSKIKLYLSVGSEEGTIKDRCTKYKSKIEIMKALNKLIQKYKNIESKFDIFEGQDHNHATASGLIMGIDYIFRK